MKDGKVYINLEYLKSNIINLNILKLAGTLCGLMQGYGMTASGITTEGIVMYGNGLDASGNANPPYLIVTDSGIRGQTSKDYEFNMAGGAFEVEGNITTRAAGNMIGNVTAAGNVSASGNVRGKVFSMMPNGEMLAQIMEENGYLQIGGSTGTYIGGRPIYIGVAGTEQILGTPVYIRGDVDFSEANVSGLNFEDLYIAGLRALNYSSETGNMAVGPASGANVVIQGDRSYLGTVGTQRAQVTGETIQVGYIAGETGKTENLTINGVNVTVNSTSTKINGDTIAVGKYGSNLANCYWRTVTMADGVTRTILTKEPYNAT